MFYVATNKGFIGQDEIVRDIRNAKSFVTFESADKEAKENKEIPYWAVVQTIFKGEN